MANACDVADVVSTRVRRFGQAVVRLGFQVADAACDYLTTVARTVCDVVENISTQICDATETITRTVCDATRRIPIIGTIVCWVSRTISEVVCIASHIVSSTVCLASHVVMETVCLTVRVVVTGTALIVGGGITLLGILLGGLAELICFFTATPQTPMRPPLPPGDTQIDPRINGDQVVPLLAADIQAAQSNIHVSMFLFFNDPMGQWLADALIARASDARNSIDVRVMFDFNKTRLGDPLSSSAKKAVEMDPNFNGDAVDVDGIVDRLRRGGVRVLQTNIDYDRVVPTSNNTYRKEARTIRRAITLDAEVVDHRKIITIDDRIGYFGSANVGCQYLYRNPYVGGTDADVEVVLELTRQIPPGREPWLKWHDSLTRVDGPLTYVMEEYFRRRWVLNGGDEYPLRRPHFAAPTIPPKMEVVVATPGFKNDIRKRYVRHIREATTSIFIENSYCYHPTIIRELIRAKKRRPKLAITMILPSPDYNDNPLSQDAQEYRYEDLLNAGITLYEFDHHFTHMKLATFDSVQSIIGSANLNYRSLEWDRDFEIAVIVSDPAIATRLEQAVQATDMRVSRQVTAATLTYSHRHRNPVTVAAETAQAL